MDFGRMVKQSSERKWEFCGTFAGLYLLVIFWGGTYSWVLRARTKILNLFAVTEQRFTDFVYYFCTNTRTEPLSLNYEILREIAIYKINYYIKYKCFPMNPHWICTPVAKLESISCYGDGKYVRQPAIIFFEFLGSWLKRFYCSSSCKQLFQSNLDLFIYGWFGKSIFSKL